WGVGVVRFENSVCKGIDGAVGTCYTRRQCRDIGGVPSGLCAAHIGYCCVVQKNCGEVSSDNNTYFVNHNFPNTVTGPSACAYTIQRCSPDICQIRIDFLNLNLAQPDGNGVCNVDVLNIVGGATNVPQICGQNSGHHVYVDFNGQQDIRMLITTGAGSTEMRTWRFKVAQIGCDSPSRAPSGCLQYYTDAAGTVSSFNYGTTISSGLTTNAKPGTRQLANTNYGICVAPKPGFCSITWSQGSDPYAFSVSEETIMQPGVLGTSNTGDMKCKTDFVIIPNSMMLGSNMSSVDRYCGNALPTVTTSSKPFVLTTVTDADEMNDNGNRGFSIEYSQSRCTSTFLMF
ncbi:PREDICTED: uncharacterized protein LOC108563729, partial [Nicrophorus vespilloides]|uniref:Uncharacterized protein LOC108563729 n=1 Tax=Nicrophorus vespilloides TaxID=110193 RepID=A0ABM1MTS3_NICVS